jgi:glycosyltransferase involved in cell wall biosynthesis
MERRIKIFVIGTRGFPHIQGGIEKHCEAIYTRLAEQGYIITVFARGPYFASKNQVPEWKGVQFKYLWCPRSKHFEAIIHSFLALCISIVKRPEIIHVHAIGPALLVPFAKLSGLKVIFTHHGHDYERQKWNYFAKLVLKLGEYCGIQYSDIIIAVSETIKHNLKLKFPGRNIITIPNGVTIPKKIPGESVLHKYKLTKKKYILSVGRFVKEKGFHDLIAAYKLIQNPSFNLVIAGDADHESKYSATLKTLAEYPSIILTGFLSEKELSELYAHAGLFILPSYHEGLSIALLEAISYNVSFLVSDIPANMFFGIEQYRFFNRGNTKDLSEKIEKLFMQDISHIEQDKLRSMLIKDYNWDNAIKQLDVLYQNLIIE